MIAKLLFLLCAVFAVLSFVYNLQSGAAGMKGNEDRVREQKKSSRFYLLLALISFGLLIALRALGIQ